MTIPRRDGDENLRIIGTGKYLDLVDEDGWEYVRRHRASGVVCIVATTDSGALVLVEQPRVPVHSRTIELPAGLVGDLDDHGEPLEVAARRELEEETGFRAARWRFLADGPSSVGMSTEIVTFFRATGLERVGPGGGDDSEDITVHVVPMTDVVDFLTEKRSQGIPVDFKVFVALHFLSRETPP
ncbi:MAG: NUDIX hydrolase [Verrucomicrobiota bacterium]